MTQEQIHQLFKHGYNQASWKQFLAETFTKAKLLASPETLTGIDSNVASKVLKLGHILLDEDGIERHIAAYEVTLAKGIILERNRVGLRNLLRKYWKDIDAAFIVYHNPENSKWRFTYVSELTGYDADGEFIKIKTEPKRYTYVLGEGESTRTAAERFFLIAKKASKATLADVKDAFSVEKLSKAFFDEYKDHYNIFCEFMVKKPNIRQTIFNGDEKAIRDFNKKLLGRIVFLYFIQKKGWMGVPVNSKWGQGDFNFLINLFNQQKNPDLFYSETLSRLFFDTLNTKRKDDLIELIKGQPCRIPYLNGGLFEEDDKKHRNIILNPKLFENLFNFFNQYNFTIYEDDPNDHTVAVDPEMLGHIFENLLEDNKDKGAYYTPKEIVHYMCQESLIEYLTTWFQSKGYEVTGFIGYDKPQEPRLFSVNEGRRGQMVIETGSHSPARQIDRSLIEKLLAKKLNDSDKKLVKQHANEFHKALDSVKIADPAIGSGAFPMGLLQEIFTAKQTLYHFEHGNLIGFPASEVKLNIIQNSIYGVDIEKGAVDIARLRFWLSLVVDEEEPKALPNLDYKIVVGDSLVSRLDNTIIEIDWNLDETSHGLFGANLVKRKTELLKRISQEQSEFFNSNSDKKKLSADIRKLKIDLIINQVELMVTTKGIETKPSNVGKGIATQTEMYLQTLGWKDIIKKLNKLKENVERPLNFFDWKLDFPEVLNPHLTNNSGFDIVIGNPPYLRIQGIREVDNDYADFLAKKFHSATGSFDLYVLFVEKGIELIKAKGIANFIMPVKWVNAAFGKGLREFVGTQGAANKIISFEAFQVFNASTYTGLQWFKKDSPQLSYYQLSRNLPDNQSLEKFLYELNPQHFNTYSRTDLNNETWTLTDDRTNLILKKLGKQSMRVKDVFERFFTGLQTSKDSVYFLLNSKSKNGEVIGYSKELDKEVAIEQGLVKPLLKGDQVHRYAKLETDNYVIFPYKFENSKATLYTEKELKRLFPKGYAYLKANEKILRGRENGKLIQDEFWFRYVYPKNLTLFDKPKLYVPYLGLKGQFSQDLDGAFYGNTKCFGLIKFENIDLDYYFLLGVLNSELLWFFLKNTGTIFRGGYFAFTPDYLNNFSLPMVSMNKQKRIIKIVEQILKLKTAEKNTSKLEKEIDSLVYRMYDLSYDEVIIVDPEFGLSKKEYHAIQLD